MLAQGTLSQEWAPRVFVIAMAMVMVIVAVVAAVAAVAV